MMPERPLVTVCVPIYNVEKYLSRCLDSIVSQSLKNIEIICVDDGSTDNSANIVERYSTKDSRVQLLKKKKNEGILLARKSAVLLSSGKYISFLDSDDWFSTDNSLQIMFDSIESLQVDMLHFSIDLNNESGVEIESYNKRFLDEVVNISGNENIIKYWDKRHLWNLWTKIYRSEIVKQAFLEIEDRNFVMWDDVYALFMISYFSNTCSRIKSDPLVTYRLGTGISTKTKLSMQDFLSYISAFEILTCIKTFLKAKNDKGLLQLIDGLYDRFCDNSFKNLFKLEKKDLLDGFKILSGCCDLSEYLNNYSDVDSFKYSVLSFICFGEAKKRYLRKKKQCEYIKIMIENNKRE